MSKFSRLNTIFVQSVKGGVGKTYIAVSTARELIKCRQNSNSICPRRDNDGDCSHRRAVYIDLDFSGTSFTDGHFVVGGKVVKQLMWKIKGKPKEKPQDLYRVYTHVVEEATPIENFKPQCNDSDKLLFIDSGTPTGLTERILYDPIYAGWMCELLRDIMMSLCALWKKNNDTHTTEKKCVPDRIPCMRGREIYFIIDCPPGFSQLTPTFTEYMLKHNGLRYTKFCYVLSPDKPDIKAMGKRVEKLKGEWESVKEVVQFYVEPAKSPVGITEKKEKESDKEKKERKNKNNYWRELNYEGYIKSEAKKDSDVFFENSQYVIMNRYSNHAMPDKPLSKWSILFDLYHQVGAENLDMIPYSELLSLAYTAFGDRGFSLEKFLKEPYEYEFSKIIIKDDGSNLGNNDLLKKLQQSDLSQFKKLGRLISSIRSIIIRYLLILMRQYENNPIPVGEYQKEYTVGIINAGKGVISGEGSPIEMDIVGKEYLQLASPQRASDLNDDDLKEVVKQSIESSIHNLPKENAKEDFDVVFCLAHYFEIVLRRLVVDGYINKDRINEVIEFLWNITRAEGLHKNHPLSFNENFYEFQDACSFFSNFKNTEIQKKLELMDKMVAITADYESGILGMDERLRQAILFMQGHLFFPSFPYTEIYNVFTGKNEVVMAPSAIHRMMARMGLK